MGGKYAVYTLYRYVHVVYEMPEWDFTHFPRTTRTGTCLFRKHCLSITGYIKALSDGRLVFSDCKALRRATIPVHGSVCVRLGLDCLLKSETAVESPRLGLLAYDW